MNLDRVAIQRLVCPPKDLLPPLPLYRNLTIPSLPPPPPPPRLKRSLLNTEAGKHWQFLRILSSSAIVSNVLRSAEYGAFQRTGGRGISSLTLSRPHCSICSFRYFSVPSIAKAQRASWSYTKGCWRWIISVASFVWQKLVFFRCLNMLLFGIIWRTAALLREKNSNLRGGKIALLFRGLNMHLVRITLEHSRYLNERKTINL